MLLLNRNILKQIEGKKMGIFGKMLEALNNLFEEVSNQAVTCQDKNHAAGNVCWFYKLEDVNGIIVYYQQHSINDLVLVSLDPKDQQVTELERSESLWVSGNEELAKLVNNDMTQLGEISISLTEKIGCRQILFFKGGKQIAIE